MTPSFDADLTPAELIRQYNIRYLVAKAELGQDPPPTVERKGELRMEIAHCTERLRQLNVYTIDVGLSNAGVGLPRFVDLGTETDVP